MLTIRLSRIGKRKQPTYRVIISEKSKDPYGHYLELLGNYNPRTKALNVKADRIKYWISKGAQTSASVNNLLINAKIIEGKKIKVVKISDTRKEKIAKAKGEEKKEAAHVPKAAELKAEAVPEIKAEEKKPEEAKVELSAEEKV
jgi:small subunit ribosomal protein S16